MEELRGRIVFAEALAHAGGQRGGEPARAIGRHGDCGTEHGDGASGHGETPLVGKLFDSTELAGIDELDVGSQDRLFRDGHGVVGPRSVHHRRGDQHQMPGVVGPGESVW